MALPVRVHRRIAAALRSFLRRRTVDRELDEELRFHFEQMAAQEAARGVRPDDAARQARRRFGGVNQVKEACRDMQPLPVHALRAD